MYQDDPFKHSTGLLHRRRSPPDRYSGYVLSDPWTTPGANIGWSLFLGEGTTAALNKIKGLAWQVLMLTNETEAALTLINYELAMVRVTVIQNRLALDLLLAEKGGVCRVLNTSCCFHIPDNHVNISDSVTFSLRT